MARDMGSGAAVVDEDWNDVAVEVRRTTITISLNGTPVTTFVDGSPQALLSGGVGVLGWWENPVTVDAVHVTALPTPAEH